MWPRYARAKGRLEAQAEFRLLGGRLEWGPGFQAVFSLSINVTAALSAVFSFTLPYLSVRGQDLGSAYAHQFISVYGTELSACLVGLLYGHLTGFDPLNFTQLINPPHLGPPDILARWIYLPVLALISLLLSLPNYFAASFDDVTVRRFLAAGAALASLLYVLLLLAYPVDSGLSGLCACQFDWRSAWDASISLRIGFYVTLVLSVYNVVANEVMGLVDAVPGPARWRNGQDDCVYAVDIKPTPKGSDEPPVDLPSDDPSSEDEPPGDVTARTKDEKSRPSLLDGYPLDRLGGQTDAQD